ncbi:hypothetical protein DOTSEDRAFT_77171 [Dothistroma septosporum NZE10]|uniref:Uncharacterized protein n=1 Tax=Dothistroma septosporum (strain NZE10 / CBS 128990) TaxID=675120 RepID=N1Q471_DOTSN|nr:hypothetical protein DOTSEDRAFT_77171 [Dothistroma septosporum NZE10]
MNLMGESSQAVDQEELLYNFHAFREQLEETGRRFETRRERFARERFDADMKQGRAGTSAEIDARQIRQIQRLTRALLSAEKEFQDAREALLEAGIQPPDSSISFGFIDDINDGYRVSLEQGIIGHVDEERMCSWLSKNSQAGGSEESPSIVDFASPMPEIDHWDSDEVELCDSWSIVENGADRRLDRWRTLAISRRPVGIDGRSRLGPRRPGL